MYFHPAYSLSLRRWQGIHELLHPLNEQSWATHPDANTTAERVFHHLVQNSRQVWSAINHPHPCGRRFEPAQAV